MFENETQAETEERLAALSGQSVVETEPEDIDETLTVCCPTPQYARSVNCGCGGHPYL